MNSIFIEHNEDSVPLTYRFLYSVPVRSHIYLLFTHVGLGIKRTCSHWLDVQTQASNAVNSGQIGCTKATRRLLSWLAR